MRTLREGLCGLFAVSVVLAGCSKAEDPAAVHRALGNDLARKSEWAAAAREYELSLQANPRDRKVWELKANAHLKLGELPQAAESLTRPAEYTSDPAAKAELYRLVASMWVEHERFVEAEKAFGEALRFNPRDELSLSWLGEIASARGGARSMSDPADPLWLKRAIAYYDQTISVNPNDLFAHVRKRIAVSKYMAYEEQERAVAQRLLQLERRDPAKVAAAQTRLSESTARIVDLKRQIDELSARIKELQAARKGKKQSTS